MDRGEPGRAAFAARGIRSVRWLVALLLGLATVAVPAGTAQAHAFLAGSSPADGQVLAEPPTQLRLQFSESVVLSTVLIDVVDPDGHHLAPTAVRLEGGDAGDLERPVEVVADLPALGRGAYRVSWETLSSDDLHPTSGVLVFGVGTAVTAGGLQEPSPRPVEAALRWLLLLGLSGALGGALATNLFRRAGDSGRSVAWARRLAGGGAIGAAGVAVLLLGDQLLGTGVDPFQLLRGSYGLRWGIREVGLLLIGGWALSLPRVPRVGRALLAGGAVLACVGTALLGHSGAGEHLDVTRVVASAVHLGAAATWSGCLLIVTLVLVLRRWGDGRARLGGRRPQLARDVLRLFGVPAAICMGIIVVTGVYLSSDVVGSVDAALLTTYGRALLLKVALVAVVGALALANTVRLRRGSARPTPRRTVVGEAVAAVAVLALAAVLTSGQPAMEPQLVRTVASATDGPLDQRVADLQEILDIRPNRPGPNVVIVDVFDTRRPAPSPVRAVDVALVTADGVAGTPIAAESLGDGRWSANATLDAPGVVGVQVTAVRDGQPDTVASYPWTIGGLPDQARPPVVSTTPIRAQLRVASLALAILVVLAWGIALVVTGRRKARASAAWEGIVATADDDRSRTLASIGARH